MILNRFSAAAYLTALAIPVFAADTGVPMTAPEFEAFVEGRTLYYSNRGKAYGVEQYLPNRRVKWSFLDGECKDGSWYGDGPFICFEYDDKAQPECWTFYNEGGRLRALYKGDPTQTELYQTVDADEPMLCLGPEIGV